MLIEKFEEQVNQTPGNIALKSRHQVLTYLELNGYANRIARMISTCASGEIVGLLFDDGIHMVAAILAALKAGKIYVPLSGDYPLQRLAYMLSDSEASLIVTGTSNKALTQKLGKDRNIPVVDIETGNHDADVPGENPSRSRSGEKLAYIMYTSGSTGRPKGVMQNHQNVLYYTRNWVRIFSIAAGDKMTLLTSLCHDGSVQDIFSALLSGATLLPYDIKKQEKTGELKEFLKEEKITIWHSVPTLFRYFVNTLAGTERFRSLRFILLGGEPVHAHDVDMIEKHFPHAGPAFIYGQTEASVNSILSIREGVRYNKPLLGTPLEGTRLFVADDEGNPVKPLRSGEILSASHHISPGYWKNPQATGEVFQDDRELGRLYWTGDMGRLLVDGNIEFLGRKDCQVKIRGYRIEPGEIETQLLHHEYIKEVVVMPNTDDDGKTFLSAYFVGASSVPGKELDVARLRNYLSERLPDYMIPSYFVRLDKMPLTVSGKIDRQKLAELEQKPVKYSRVYEEPKTELEKIIALAWKEVLKLEEVGIYDNFFDLGGNSLDILTVNSRLEKEMETAIPTVTLFRYPTIHTLAAYLSRGCVEEDSSTREEEISVERNEGKNRLKERIHRSSRL
jgi:amino acid adenylation domain-containing protein